MARDETTRNKLDTDIDHGDNGDDGMVDDMDDVIREAARNSRVPCAPGTVLKEGNITVRRVDYVYKRIPYLLYTSRWCAFFLGQWTQTGTCVVTFGGPKWTRYKFFFNASPSVLFLQLPLALCSCYGVACCVFSCDMDIGICFYLSFLLCVFVVMGVIFLRVMFMAFFPRCIMFIFSVVSSFETTTSSQ